jgi:hypothetical protein
LPIFFPIADIAKAIKTSHKDIELWPQRGIWLFEASSSASHFRGRSFIVLTFIDQAPQNKYGIAGWFGLLCSDEAVAVKIAKEFISWFVACCV